MAGSSPTCEVSSAQREDRLTLAIFIDALGWEISKRYGFLPDLLPEQKPLKTVFGYSSTCDPTILTGVAPREHGHFAFYAYSPRNSPFKKLHWLKLLPKGLADRGRVRHQISRIVQKQLGFTGYFQLYNAPFELLPEMEYTEQRDLYTPGGIINGQKTLFDDLRGSAIPFHLSDWRKGERENLDAAAHSLASGQPQFAYVFLAQMDAILHAKGTQSEEVERKIRWYEKEIRRLVTIAERKYSRITLAVFSDHGMTDIHSEFNLMEVIARLPLTLGEDYFAVYDSTMARFWFFNAFAEQTITRTLETHEQGRWLSEADQKKWGCDFENQRYGHKFYLLNPGVLLNPSFMGNTRLAGMHGYAPHDKDSVAFFATSDKSFGSPHGLSDLRSLLFKSVCNGPAVGATA